MAINEAPKKVDRWFTRHQVAMLRVWVVAFTFLVILLLVQGRSRDSKIEYQAKQNRHLIQQLKQNQKALRENQKAIQRSRVRSCISNVNNLLHAFDPFIPKKDDPRTPRNEVRDFKLFRDNLIEKRGHCAQQVAIKPRRANAKP